MNTPLETSQTALEEEGQTRPLLILFLKRKKCGKVIFSCVDFSLKVGVNPSPKKFKTFPGAMRSYTVKENHVGSAVSKTFQYRQTETDFVIT